MIQKSKPVWIDKVEDNQYIEAKQVFVAKSDKNATLEICADAEYAAFINGKFVGGGQYKTFPGKKVYDEYDISAFLQIGENVLTVTAYHQGRNTSTYVNAPAMVAFSVNMEGATVLSGEETDVRPHPHYKSGEIELITFQLGYSFCYDAGKEGTSWAKATIVDADAEFEKRPVKKLVREDIVVGKISAQGVVSRCKNSTPAEAMQSDFLSAREYDEIFAEQTVKKQEQGAYFVIDLGDEYAGQFTMSLEAEKGTVIDIAWGEHLDDMRVRASVGGRSFACRYITGGGKEEFTSYFRRFACRYIEVHITNMTGDVKFSEIGIIPTNYPIERQAEFKCNDYLFNKIYEISLKTMKLCMHEHYEDCPWREQALYAYDSYVQMMCGYYAFGEYEFARASLELLSDAQREDGLLEITAPGKASITIPSFALAWIISLEKYALYSGDLLFAKEKLLRAKKILDSFEIKDGLLKNKIGDKFWNFCEWTSGLDGTTCKDCESDAVSSLYYVLAVMSYNEICKHLGKEPYDADIEYMKTRINETFYDEERGLYKTRIGDERIHEFTQALAIKSGVTNDERVWDRLASKDNGLIRCTLSTSIFKYEVLLDEGEKYVDAVTDEIAEVWGDMLFSGAKTLWETSEGAPAFENAGSLCHAWSAVPVYLLYRYYIGFKPETPGFFEYSVNPIKSKLLNGFKAELLSPLWNKGIEIKNGEIIK